jgi:hypothetical protein
MMYRAEFSQPLLHLNPMKLRVSAPVTIEVYSVIKRPARWRARALTANDKPGNNINWETRSPIEGDTARTVQAFIEKLFENRLTPWAEIEDE